MRRGIDANVLVYAHVPSFQEHRAVRAFLLEQLRDPDTLLFLTPSILQEFVHVVTDARRFEPALDMSEALQLAAIYLDHGNFWCLAIDESILLRAFDLMKRHRLGRKRIVDTVFAATLIHYGIRELVTCNLRDFGVFEELTLVDPRS